MKRIPLYLFLIILPLSLHAQQKKNVLFLMADDFNYWARIIGYYPEARTPHIDSLARMGVLFSNAQCSSPVCNPSRNAMWSGYRPSTTLISRNSDGYVRDREGFHDIVTMNQYFTGNGYYTYAIGKLYHPGRMGSYETDPDNWSQINTSPSGCNGGSLYSYECSGWTSLKFSANTSALSTSNCNDYNMAQIVSDFLQSYDPADHSGMPFFLGCGFFRPHLPWNSPKEFWDLIDYENLVIPAAVSPNDVPEKSQQAIVADGMWMRAIQAYLASMALADSNVKVVLDALEDSRFRDNTIILFMGDHGWHLGEKGHWGKFTTWDEANHTTLIIYDPSAAGNGRECTKVVSLQDLYPTLVELCGLPEKKDIEGRSLVPLLQDPQDPEWDWPVLMRYGDKDYIKTNDWRFVEDGNDSRLYNMQTDPYEWDNIYGDPSYQDVVDKLRAQMDSMISIGAAFKDSLLNSHGGGTAEMHYPPGRMEAESYSQMSGIQVENTADSGGGQDISFINNNDWATYGLTVNEPGLYRFSFRVASASNGGQIRVYQGSTLLGTADVPNTGGWQEWETVESEIELTGGTYLLKFVFTGSGTSYLFNLNYTDTELLRGLGVAEYVAGRNLVLTTVPVNNHLTLDLTYTNPVAKVEIYGITGTLLQTEYVSGEQEVTIPLHTDLAEGVYLVRVDDRDNIFTGTFMIQ